MNKSGSYPKIMANDPIVLEELIYSYSDALVRYAYCYVGSSASAEDIMEDAFAALLVKNLSFYSLEQARSWLYKCVHGKAVDYLRRHRREIPLCDVENVLAGSDMEQSFLRKERNQVLFRSIQSLPRQYRQVLTLSYFDGFCVPEICQILGKNAKQVYNLQTRAKTALKEILLKEGFCDEEF